MARAPQIMASPVFSQLRETKRSLTMVDVSKKTSILALWKQDGTISTIWQCHMWCAIAMVMVVTNIVHGLIVKTQKEPVSQRV